MTESTVCGPRPPQRHRLAQRHAIRAWQSAIKILQVEKEVETRKAVCWKKVRDWLKDDEDGDCGEAEDECKGW